MLKKKNISKLSKKFKGRLYFKTIKNRNTKKNPIKKKENDKMFMLKKNKKVSKLKKKTV